LHFGRGAKSDEEDEEGNDAPTVVIDSSLDEKDIAAQEKFKNLEDDP
jgi:hypothetical protein